MTLCWCWKRETTIESARCFLLHPKPVGEKFACSVTHKERLKFDWSLLSIHWIFLASIETLNCVTQQTKRSAPEMKFKTFFIFFAVRKPPIEATQVEILQKKFKDGANRFPLRQQKSTNKRKLSRDFMQSIGKVTVEDSVEPTSDR